MAKKRNFQPDVELIPYYEYDPSIHNIEYRYIQDPSAWYTYNNNATDGEFDSTETDDYNFDSEDYRFYGPYPYGYVRPRRRRRRRRFYPPFFAPLPLPLPVPYPSPYYGGYPYAGGGYPYYGGVNYNNES